MNKGKRYRSLYLPAWSIVAAVLTLLLIIAVSTYRNMSRETGRMEDSLVREGLVIIRAIEASVRADFPSRLPEPPRLQKLVEEVSREPEVAAITIFDAEGNIVAASHPAGPASDRVPGVSSLKLLMQERGMVTRYRPQPGGTQVFDVIQPFRPFTYHDPRLSLHPPGGRHETQERPLRRWAEDKMISLSLRLATFESARKEDRHHTLLMAAILVILGTGALYFIFVVQNYYLVDRSLDRMKSYTENVVESMADGLISLDREGRIVTVNSQAADILAPAGDVWKGGISRMCSEQGRSDSRCREWTLLCAGPGDGCPAPERRHDSLDISVAPLKDEKGQEWGPSS